MPRKASRVRVRAAAECHAEVALCRLLGQQLARLNKGCHVEVTEKDIDHKPRKGGRERVIVEAVRRACRHGYSLLLVVDYERERASRRYVERICRHGLVVWSSGGAAVKVCGGVVEVPGASLRYTCRGCRERSAC